MSFMAFDSKISTYTIQSLTSLISFYYLGGKDNLISENKIMLYLYAVLYFTITIFTIQNVTAKNHFKGKVFKDPYKIKRLVHFQNNLCKEVDNLLRNHDSLLLRYV